MSPMAIKYIYFPSNNKQAFSIPINLHIPKNLISLVSVTSFKIDNTQSIRAKLLRSPSTKINPRNPPKIDNLFKLEMSTYSGEDSKEDALLSLITSDQFENLVSTDELSQKVIRNEIYVKLKGQVERKVMIVCYILVQ